MNRGDPLWVQEPDGSWARATYEFRVEEGEPLGHHSVLLANGGGRRVVCGCKTSLVDRDSRPVSIYVMRGKAQVTPHHQTLTSPPTGIERIVFLVSGEEVSLDAMAEVSLAYVIDKALQESKNTHRSDWEARDASGRLIADLQRPVSQIDVPQPIFITAPVGVGA
jgi:hypothetical protein